MESQVIRIHCEIGASQQSSIQFYQVPTCQTNEIQHHPMKSYGIPFANMWTFFQESTKLDEIIRGAFCIIGSKLTKNDEMLRGTPRKVDVNSTNFNATLVSTSHQKSIQILQNQMKSSVIPRAKWRRIQQNSMESSGAPSAKQLNITQDDMTS